MVVETRNQQKQGRAVPAVRREGRKLKLQIVKLEERIAPKLATNHNETLVHDR
jgi:hypothetical protein